MDSNNMSWNEITLENLGNGAANELFNHELGKVIENIDDVNMPAKSVREITLKIKIKPDDKRTACNLDISCHAKLAQTVGHATNMFLVRKGPKKVAVQQDVEQLNMEFSPELADAAQNAEGETANA